MEENDLGGIGLRGDPNVLTMGMHLANPRRAPHRVGVVSDHLVKGWVALLRPDYSIRSDLFHAMPCIHAQFAALMHGRPK